MRHNDGTSQLTPMHTTSERRTHDLVDSEYGADVDTRVDVAATVQRVEDDAILALIPILDDDRVLEFFRDEHGTLAGCAQRVDHDVI